MASTFCPVRYFFFEKKLTVVNLEKPLIRSLKIDFKQKVEAGADSAITQYFYNIDAYFNFIDSCHKLDIDIPIIPGIMPISNYEQLIRFSDTCGAEIPRWLRRRLQDFAEDKTALQDYGVDITTHLCERLLAGGAPGLHFYSLNQKKLTLEIAKRLGLLKKNQ